LGTSGQVAIVTGAARSIGRAKGHWQIFWPALIRSLAFSAIASVAA